MANVGIVRWGLPVVPLDLGENYYLQLGSFAQLATNCPLISVS